MTLRDATPADVPAICALWNPLIRDTAITFTSLEKTEGDIRSMITDRAAKNMPFLVAHKGEELLGFATYAPFRSGPGYAHTMEHTVILSETATGQGLGRRLLRALETHGRNAGVHVMVAGVSSGNPRAIAFHRAVGYGETAVLSQVGRKFDQWYDLHLMQKRL